MHYACNSSNTISICKRIRPGSNLATRVKVGLEQFYYCGSIGDTPGSPKGRRRRKMAAPVPFMTRRSAFFAFLLRKVVPYGHYGRTMAPQAKRNGCVHCRKMWRFELHGAREAPAPRPNAVTRARYPVVWVAGAGSMSLLPAGRGRAGSLESRRR